MTAAVYMRGLLQHEYGVKPSDVEWVQGRADRLGRKLPADIRLTQAPAGTELGDLLERGEIDFLMTANNPLSFRRGSPNVRRLFPNYAEDGEGLLPAHEDLSDHAHGGDPPRHLRPRSVGGALALQGAVPRQGTLLPAAARTRLAEGVVRLAAADDRGGAGDHRAATGIPTASSRTGRRSRRCCNTPTSTG